jgi:hypothetical protein
MNIEDKPTEQIRRPATAAPLPGPLQPGRQQPSAPATDDSAESGSTEVLSLDDVLDGPVTMPASTLPPAAASPPAAPRIGAVPVGTTDQRTDDGHGARRADAVAAWRGGFDRSRAWVSSGDNVVIAATAVIALVLLLAVALF